METLEQASAGAEIIASGAVLRMLSHYGSDSAPAAFLVAAATPLGFTGTPDERVTSHRLRLAVGTFSGRFANIYVQEFDTVGIPANGGQPLDPDVAVTGCFAETSNHVEYQRWEPRDTIASAVTIGGRKVVRVTLTDGLTFAAKASRFERWI
jgi:hypothetical protein